MDKVNLVAFPNQNSNQLGEIGQSMDVKFAYVNANYEQVMHPCKCRDFLGDMIWSRKNGKKASIYGMIYDYAEKPYDLESTRFSLKFPSPRIKKNFIKNFEFLTDKEDTYGLSRAVLFETDKNDTLVIEADKEWQTQVWKISLFTFFIKLMCYDDVTEPDSPEDRYLAALTPPLLHNLLTNIRNDTDDNWANDLWTAHNYSGFFSICSGNHKVAAVREFCKVPFVPFEGVVCVA